MHQIFTVYELELYYVDYISPLLLLIAPIKFYIWKPQDYCGANIYRDRGYRLRPLVARCGSELVQGDEVSLWSFSSQWSNHDVIYDTGFLLSKTTDQY